MNLETLWSSLQGTLGSQAPQLLYALALLFVGWLVAVVARAGVVKGLATLGLNRRLSQAADSAVDVEKGVGLGVFWLIILFTLVAVFNTLNLTLVSGPLSSLLQELIDYAPNLLAGGALAFLAWLVATSLKLVTRKLLDKTSLDEKLSEHARMTPISASLADTVFWVVILLFLILILDVLGLQSLVAPLSNMLDKTLAILPNAVAALVVGGVGWLVATVLRNIVSNLAHTAGLDKLGSVSGNLQLSRVLGLFVFVAVFLPALVAAFDALHIEAISRPATDIIGQFLSAIPHVVAAGLILLVTWVVASFVSRLLSSLLAGVGLDTVPGRVGLGHVFERLSASALVGHIVLFFAMLFATVEAAAQLGFHQVGQLVTNFIEFGGNVLLGSVILVVGFWLANLAYQAVDRASGSDTKGLANVARYAILALVIAMGLRAIGIADDIVNLAFGLTLGAVAVAFALSFGLGGRDAAGDLLSHWLEKYRKDK